MAALIFTQHYWQNVQIIKKAGIVFRKMMQMYLEHKEVKHIINIICVPNNRILYNYNLWKFAKYLHAHELKD